MTDSALPRREASIAVTLGDIYAARCAIQGQVRRTPLLRSATLSELCGADVHLKLETAHETRAFKIRGATNFMAALSAVHRRHGVVTVSTGNHGRAVALAARRLGVRAVVFMSELVPRNKRDAIAGLGAEVRIAGRSQDEAQCEATAAAAAEGLLEVHAFDDPKVIAGQGTIALELLEDLGRIDSLVCPVSGGGLMSGIALALKAANPSVRIIGVSMDRGPAMYQSVKAGEPVDVVEEETLADCLGGGIGRDNRYTFDLIRSLVDEFVLVSEAQIRAGMRHLYWREGIISEGGGAVACAALAAAKVSALSGNVACVISGANIDMQRFTSIVTDSR